MTSDSSDWIILLVAHGTPRSLDQLPEFLAEIRRGRPAPPELVREMRRRYEAIGGSPLEAETQAQARALEAELGVPVRMAMRLSEPRVPDVLGDVSAPTRVCLLPIAPFSVAVYAGAARAALAERAAAPELVCVEPYGNEPLLIDAWASAIERELDLHPADLVLLSAHSLPTSVIARGDRYQAEFEKAARAVGERLGASRGVAVRLCYQSAGASEEPWLGPHLEDCLREAKTSGVSRLLIAPIGFLAEHVETLYDLDLEAQAEARALGLELRRVPALGQDPAFIRALGAACRRAMGEHEPDQAASR